MHIVEISPALASYNAQTLIGIEVPRHGTTVSTMCPPAPRSSSPTSFFDALPVHQAVRHDERLA
ncbi:MAG: hypothetical protein QM703_02190 [Gemmatales bacterium]